jgi:hypothetical protein
LTRFHLRGFASVLLSLTFLVVAASGLLMWLVHPSAPGGGPGLILGIGMGAWKSAHIYVSLLMLVAAVTHFCLNWSLYCSYLWSKAGRRVNQKWEIGLALAMTVAVAWGSSLLASSRDAQRLASMSPKDVAERAGRPVDQVVSLLEKEGIAVHDPADSVKEIAEHNQVASADVLAAMGRVVPEGMRPPRGGPPH